MLMNRSIFDLDPIFNYDSVTTPVNLSTRPSLQVIGAAQNSLISPSCLERRIVAILQIVLSCLSVCLSQMQSMLASEADAWRRRWVAVTNVRVLLNSRSPQPGGSVTTVGSRLLAESIPLSSSGGRYRFDLEVITHIYLLDGEEPHSNFYCYSQCPGTICPDV
ncbi:hypothetical protein J6590_071207 [Homalodisca vitripennis]|nr:hypothetical protein J6590_071207 [Homalodisca vitripennis]